MSLNDKHDTVFYRSNGYNVYKNGHGVAGFPSIKYNPGQTVSTTFNMSTGQITWKIEETNETTKYTFNDLKKGSWIFSTVIYGAKVELLPSFVEMIDNLPKPLQEESKYNSAPNQQNDMTRLRLDQKTFE